MVTHEAFLTRLFNSWFGPLGNFLLAIFGIHADDRRHPWGDFIVMQLLVAAIMVVLFLILRSRLSVARPGILQQLFELIHGFVGETAEDQVGHEGRRHVVLFETLFIFILISNLLGIVPQFMSPTQAVYVPCGIAILSFLYYNITGITNQGVWHYT